MRTFAPVVRAFADVTFALNLAICC